jgi:hypothetical protein
VLRTEYARIGVAERAAGEKTGCFYLFIEEKGETKRVRRVSADAQSHRLPLYTRTALFLASCVRQARKNAMAEVHVLLPLYSSFFSIPASARQVSHSLKEAVGDMCTPPPTAGQLPHQAAVVCSPLNDTTGGLTTSKGTTVTCALLAQELIILNDNEFIR